MLELVNRQKSGDPSMRVIALRMGRRRVPLVFSAIQTVFRSLTLNLPVEQSIYGLAYHDTPSTAGPLSLQQIAAQEAELLLRFHSGGPIALAGWCAEGVPAYEMAQQIRARGIDVPLLVLFDSFAGNQPERRWLAFRRTQYHLGVARRMPATGVLAYARERVRTLSARIRTRAWAFRKRLGWLRPRVSGEPGEFGRVLALAAGEYSPQPYSGAVLLFRPQDRPAGADAAPGWRRLAQRLTVVDVPGTHVEMFREPNVAIMAEALNAALADLEDEVQRHAAPEGRQDLNQSSPARA